jgi:hypothetical protein
MSLKRDKKEIDEKRKCRIFKSNGGFGPSRLLCIAAVCLLSLTQWYQKNKNKEKKRKECRKPLVTVKEKSPRPLKKKVSIQIASLGSSHVGGIM